MGDQAPPVVWLDVLAQGFSRLELTHIGAAQHLDLMRLFRVEAAVVAAGRTDNFPHVRLCDAWSSLLSPYVAPMRRHLPTSAEGPSAAAWAGPPAAVKRR